MEAERERGVLGVGSSSAALEERARRRVPGGVNSSVRLESPPVYFARGRGAWLWDVDGNDYVDYLLGQGPAFLGHAPPRVLRAVERASRDGMVFGGRHAMEVEAAELMCEMLAWPDMIRFGSTGTEMVQAALRLARAATGRRRFVRFEGHYHGWLDNVLLALQDGRPSVASAGQLREHLEEAFVLPWNDLDALGSLLAEHGHVVGAVLMEPMMLNAGAIEPRPGFLEGARRLCRRHGAVLVFDEVITGFRLGSDGAVGRFGVAPDLAVYGKAMGSGWPVAALAGRSELMELLGGSVNHAGTFNGNVMAMAATIATMHALKENPPYERIQRVGGQLMDGLMEAAKGRAQLRIQGLPVAFHASLAGGSEVWDYRGLASSDVQGYRALCSYLIEEGLWVAGRGIWYLSAAHRERELEVTLERAEAAFRRL